MLIQPNRWPSRKVPFPAFGDSWCTLAMAGILRPFFASVIWSPIKMTFPSLVCGGSIFTPNAQVDGHKANLSETPDVNLFGGGHFATRDRAYEFTRLMGTIPDPDPILKKTGKNINVLHALLTDSHLESVWSIRCAATSRAQWFMAGEGGGKKEQDAADSFTEQLTALDVPRIIEEMMGAVAYGYAPLEILWKKDGDFWGIENIVGNPPDWFEFDRDNRLVLIRYGIVPDNRFLVVQHRPTYVNPYGDKTFSKCFWPVTLKKKGMTWWTVFVEKYGGAFLFGKYPDNCSDESKKKLLDSLDRMVIDVVAVFPESTDITIESLANKGSVSNVPLEYINAANAEISKAVLGQTLTTEISGKTGSYAAAQTHNQVREDLAKADRSRISAAFDRLARIYTVYNFGAEVIPPRFTYIEDEELYVEHVKRDVDLYRIGWRPTKAYIAREYALPEEDFSLAGEPEPQGAGSFRERAPVSGCKGGHTSTGYGDCKEAERPGFLKKLFRTFVVRFASKAEKVRSKDKRLMKGVDFTPFGRHR